MRPHYAWPPGELMIISMLGIFHYYQCSLWARRFISSNGLTFKQLDELCTVQSEANNASVYNKHEYRLFYYIRQKKIRTPNESSSFNEIFVCLKLCTMYGFLNVWNGMNDYIIVWNMQYIYQCFEKCKIISMFGTLWMIMFETVHDYIYINV